MSKGAKKKKKNRFTKKNFKTLLELVYSASIIMRALINDLKIENEKELHLNWRKYEKRKSHNK